MHDAGTFFLGIVAEDDLLKGRIEPSYIVTKRNSESQKAVNFFVKRANRTPWSKDFASIYGSSNKPMMFTHIWNYEHLITYLSVHRLGHKRDAYAVVKGALFWFPCDQNGNIVRFSSPIFAKRTPDKNREFINFRDQRHEYMKNAESKVYTTNELFNREPESLSNVLCEKKLRIPQQKGEVL